MGIVAANRKFEGWLRDRLKEELDEKVVVADLKAKHHKMAKDAFSFLRATYWRWAETILTACPDAADAPAVLAVGDTHLENFGTWTDKEGRICWGVNDYDEAAEMPYILDLIRLATSATLTPGLSRPSLETTCKHLLAGYKRGIEAPEAFVLDRRHMWLRRHLVVGENARTKFWNDREEEREEARKNRKPQRPPQACLDLFAEARPEPVDFAYWPHTAGTGSLGRPRWLAYAQWRGGPLLRESKALVPSAWVRAQGGETRLRVNDIAGGTFRTPDPWYRAHGPLLVRRLSPNNRKLDIKHKRDAKLLMSKHLLHAMGRDLAAVHLGTGDRADAVRTDLEKRKLRWLCSAVEAAAKCVTTEFADWQKSAK